MPFDTGRFTDTLPRPVLDFVGWSAGNERNPATLIPYFDHVAPDVMALKDGSLMAMVALNGEPFQLSDNNARNGFSNRHFALLQLLADPYTEITEHLVCHDAVPPFRGAEGGSAYWQEFQARYTSRALRGLRRLDWFISIIVHPKPFSSNPLGRMKAKWSGGDPVIDSRAINTLAAKVGTITAAFRSLSPRRLGLRWEGNGIGSCAFSEIGEALELIRTTRRRAMPLAQPAGAFPWVFHRDRVVHGPLGFLIERAGGRTGATVGRMFGLGVYPKLPRVGMFDKLLSDQDSLIGARWVMTNTIRPVSRAAATDKIILSMARMEKSGIVTEDDFADLEKALAAVTAAQEVRGQHAWSFAVHADDMATLDRHAAALVDIIAGAGCSPLPGGMAGEAIYWSQLPGNRRLCGMPARVGLRRFAMLSPLNGYPVGESQTHWDYPLLRFATAGGTAYDHSLFDGQLGHTLFCGPSGGGKTALVGSALTAATALVGPNGMIFTLDKDCSNKLSILNNGGTYTELKRGTDSGAAPLQRLPNTVEGRSAAVDLICGMILASNPAPISERAKTRIGQGVAFVMRMPAEKRTIGAVHAWLPPGTLDPSDAASRLKPWCRGERQGWAFDGERDTIDITGQLVGVDVTALLEDAAVLPVMAAYILHLASRMMDGRRFIFVVEEGKFLLPKPEFATRFEDIILTGRKKNVAFWFVIQQPEHLLSHPLGHALLGQMRTRFLFKNELANRSAYIDGLHCTPQEYAQVREGMTAGAWSVLIQRPGKNVLCRFDLSSMPDDLLIVSGTPQTVALWDRIAETRREFIERKKEAKA